MNEEAINNLLSVLADVIRSESSEEMKALRLRLMQRIIDETQTVTPRMPAPLNITEIGGYYNLLNSIGQETVTMRKRLIATALGLPME